MLHFLLIMFHLDFGRFTVHFLKTEKRHLDLLSLLRYPLFSIFTLFSWFSNYLSVSLIVSFIVHHSDGFKFSLSMLIFCMFSKVNSNFTSYLFFFNDMGFINLRYTHCLRVLTSLLLLEEHQV
jgi:hypothetical protein